MSVRPEQPLGPPSLSPAHAGAGDRLYLWLTALFVTCLLMANILGVKLFRFQLPVPTWLSKDGLLPVEHTVGMFSFPITFVLTDLMNEYFGKRATRRCAIIAFTMGGLAFALITLARRVPIMEGYPGTATQASFENIFGSATLMYIASLVAFLLGSFLDIFLFGVFKRATGGRMVWLRATGSTVVSQVFDSFIVTFMAFGVLQSLTGGQAWTTMAMVKTAATGYILKFVIAVSLTPVIYLGRWMVREFLGLRPLAAE